MSVGKPHFTTGFSHLMVSASQGIMPIGDTYGGSFGPKGSTSMDEVLPLAFGAYGVRLEGLT